MPNIYNISSKDILKVAKLNGYELTRQKGSHIVLKNSQNKILVIPNHPRLKIGTTLQIIKVLGLTKEEFLTQL